jgi:hypothetical protein
MDLDRSRHGGGAGPGTPRQAGRQADRPVSGAGRLRSSRRARTSSPGPSARWASPVSTSGSARSGRLCSPRRAAARPRPRPRCLLSVGYVRGGAGGASARSGWTPTGTSAFRRRMEAEGRMAYNGGRGDRSPAVDQDSSPLKAAAGNTAESRQRPAGRALPRAAAMKCCSFEARRQTVPGQIVPAEPERPRLSQVAVSANRQSVARNPRRCGR